MDVRRGLEALIARPVFYELRNWLRSATTDGLQLGVINGYRFPVGAAGAHQGEAGSFVAELR